MYELVSSFCSFFLVFPSRRLSVTCDIQNLFKYDAFLTYIQKPIQNLVKNSQIKVFAKIVAAFSFRLFSQKTPSQMFCQILNSPMQPATICGKSSISDVERVFNLSLQPLIICKKVHLRCLIFDRVLNASCNLYYNNSACEMGLKVEMPWNARKYCRPLLSTKTFSVLDAL